MDFYNSLNYSFGNEDWNVEKDALQVEDGDKVLCVTASGDRPLHLLLTSCQKVISIDVNPSQTALLELKMATYNRFDYEKSLAFLGCNETSSRLNLYNEVKSDLSKSCRIYWDKNQTKIKKGVIYQGRTEKLCRISAKLMNLIRKEKNKKLFSFEEIEKQCVYIDNIWDSKGFRKFFEIFIHPFILKFLSNDPGITAYTDYTDTPGKYLYQKMLAYLHSHLGSKSALLQLIFTGDVKRESYPPYLTFDGYEIIRKRLDLLEFHTTNIVDYLHKKESNFFNVFSMSDIASYMPQSAFENLLQGMRNAAAPNARFCLRELFSKRCIPNELKYIFQRNMPLEQMLEREDSNFVYRFITGKIAKK